MKTDMLLKGDRHARAHPRWPQPQLRPKTDRRPAVHLPHRSLRWPGHRRIANGMHEDRPCSTSATAASAASSLSLMNARPATTPRRASNAMMRSNRKTRSSSIRGRPASRCRRIPRPLSTRSRSRRWPTAGFRQGRRVPLIFNPPATYWDGLRNPQYPAADRSTR